MTQIQMAFSEPVKLRLEGIPLDVEIMTATLRALYRVTYVSRDRPNVRCRRDHVRRYLTIETELK